MEKNQEVLILGFVPSNPPTVDGSKRLQTVTNVPNLQLLEFL
jgi:hypothetical protein